MTDKERFKKFLEDNQGKRIHPLEFMEALFGVKADRCKKEKDSKDKIDFRKFHIEEEDDVLHLKYGDFYVFGITDEGRGHRGSNLPDEFDTDDEGRIKLSR